MPSWRETVYGIYGAWRLARLDRAAMAYFDQTLEGFWKSFFAAAIVAPGYVMVVLYDLSGQEIPSGFLRVLIVHVTAYSLSWTAFPLVAYHICGAIGRPEAYFRFIVAFNWAKVIQMVAYLPVMGVMATGLLSPGGSGLLNGLTYFVLLAYQWFVTRTALGVGPGGAAALVGLDLAIGILINGIAFGLLR